MGERRETPTINRMIQVTHKGAWVPAIVIRVTDRVVVFVAFSEDAESVCWIDMERIESTRWRWPAREEPQFHEVE